MFDASILSETYARLKIAEEMARVRGVPLHDPNLYPVHRGRVKKFLQKRIVRNRRNDNQKAGLQLKVIHARDGHNSTV